MTQDTNKLRGVFAMFSCVGFRLAFIGKRGEPNERYPMGVPIHELHETGAFRGATVAWDYAGAQRDPTTVFADIERRGDQWRVDVITNAYSGSRYDCLFASVYSSLEVAYATLEWLSTDDWKVLREGPKGPNGSTVLTEEQKVELALFTEQFEPTDDDTRYTIRGRSIDGPVYLTSSSDDAGWGDTLGMAQLYLTRGEVDAILPRLQAYYGRVDLHDKVGRLEVLITTHAAWQKSYDAMMEAAERYEAEEFDHLNPNHTAGGDTAIGGGQ